MVTVHWAHVGDADSSWLGVLDATERARHAGYRRVADQRRFLVAATLVRVLLGESLGIAPDAVPVDRRCGHCGRAHGAPRVDGGGLRVSVAHSADVVVVASAAGVRVGVDVERAPSAARLADLRRGALDSVESAPTAADFASVWARKEAVLKCTGDGLQVAPREVIVTPAHRPPALLRYPGRADLPHLMTLSALQGTPVGYRSALAVYDRAMPVVVEASGGARLSAALPTRIRPASQPNAVAPPHRLAG